MNKHIIRHSSMRSAGSVQRATTKVSSQRVVVSFADSPLSEGGKSYAPHR